MFKDRSGNYKLKIAFDFDDTLTEPVMFALAQLLIRKGHDVWIMTARYDSEYNVDLHKAAKELGIVNKIIYTDCEEKRDFFLQNKFDVLFDDDAEWHCNSICAAGGIAINV
jgi:hypothetical protein